MVLMEQGRAVCVVLAEIFSDVVCMYVAIKQNIVRSEMFLENFTEGNFSGKDREEEEEERRNINQGKGKEKEIGKGKGDIQKLRNHNSYEREKDNFISHYYSSLRSLSPLNDLLISTCKNLKKILIDIIKFISEYSTTDSPASFIPLTAYCLEFLPKKVQESLRDKIWR